MIKKRNWIRLLLILLITIGLSVVLIRTPIVDIEKILVLGSDFQYNIASLSSVIAGFLFTGIGILISAIDKERIKKLWDHHYLDNLYRTAFIGIFSNIITIICAIVTLCSSEYLDLGRKLIKIEIISIVVGIVFFVWCTKMLSFIIGKIKNKKGKNDNNIQY